MLLTSKEAPNPPPVENFSTNDILTYGKRRWRRVQFLADQFWCRWKTNYLTSLQTRNKWKTKQLVKVGDIVLVRGKTKRNQWPVASIVELKTSQDGLVRSIKLKIPTSDNNFKILERALHDTVLLIPADKR